MTISACKVLSAFFSLPPEHVVLSQQDRCFTREQIGNCAGWIAEELSRGDRTEVVFVASTQPAVVISAVVGAWSQGMCPVVLDNLPKYPWPPSSAENLGRLVLDADFRLDVVLPQLHSPPIVLFGREKAPNTAWVEGCLAYGVRTSGTTETPRIALNTWAGLNNRLEWMVSFLRGCNPPTIGLCTPLAFDSFYWEFALPILLRGQMRCGHGPYTRALPDLVTDLSLGRLNCIDLTPTVMQLLLRSPQLDAAGCARVELVVLGGETTTKDLLELVRQRFVNARIINLYGPSECSIGSVFADVTTHIDDPVPIGQPIPNTGAKIIDAIASDIPGSIEGELVLTGACVGAGYLDSPQHTAARFSNGEDGAQYRTGDICRKDHKNNFYFVRRTNNRFSDLEDFKSRGVRHDFLAWITGIVEILGASDWTYRIVTAEHEAPKIFFDLIFQESETVPSLKEVELLIKKSSPPSQEKGTLSVVKKTLGASGKAVLEKLHEIGFPISWTDTVTLSDNDDRDLLLALFPSGNVSRSFRDLGGGFSVRLRSEFEGI